MTFELKTYFIYILASKPRGVLYIGFTSDLAVRVAQHRFEEANGFTKRYFIKRLVYYESFADPSTGITREKQLKKWNREWKIKLIEKHNPEWLDLYQDGEILPLPTDSKIKIPANCSTSSPCHRNDKLFRMRAPCYRARLGRQITK